MPKLYSSRVVISTLQRTGFAVVSQRGSHIKLQKQKVDKILTAIVPNHKEIAIGTFSSILKQAGMTRSHFKTSFVIPAKAGIHLKTNFWMVNWIPAYAGMTVLK